MLSLVKKHVIAIIICISCFCLLSYFAYHNEFSEGGADNYWHYFFSKYAYIYPGFFLHHWGKPLFILLSSPFSQFGFYGLNLFNILCGISAAVVSYKFAIELNYKLSWPVIIILIFSPLYFIVLQSALTEPLMSLIIVTAMYLLYKEKFIYAALVMSFSLYARTEGIFLTLYILLYLSFIKQWRSIPFLTVGFFIYSFAGLIFGHNFLWYFTENPYNIVSPYGHGEWSDFFKKYTIIFGAPETIGLCIGLIIILFLSIKKIKKLNFSQLIPEHKFLLLAVVPAVLLFMFHVIVWKFGLCGSFGLERVITCVSPLFSLIICYGINYIINFKFFNRISIPMVSAFLFLVVLYTFKHVHYPLKAYGGDKIELEAGKWFKHNFDQNCIVYYAHPAIIFNAERDPFDKKLNIEEFDLNADSLSDKSLPTYIFWDSQFSEFSCRVKLDVLLTSKKLKLIYHPQEDYDFNLYVFELI